MKNIFFHKITICSWLILLLHGSLPARSHDSRLDVKKYYKGNELLEAAIKTRGSNLYTAADQYATYLANFPHKAYEIKNISGFGRMCVDGINDVIKNRLRGCGIWEGDITPYIVNSIKPGTIALDIGAHVGTHTISMSRAVGPHGLVIAFEPQKKIFRELYFNLILNNCVNVIPIRCALDSRHAYMVIRQDVPNNEGASYLMPDGPGERVITVCLDDFNLNNVSCIKMDTENSEEDVLKGAIQTIKRCKPTIVIEIQGNDVRTARHGEDKDARTKSIIGLLESLGYRVELITHCEYIAYPV